MKIVAVMEVSPTDGGGFYQALNAVVQMKRLCGTRFEFSVAVMHPGTGTTLAALGIDSFPMPITLFDRIRFLVWNRRPAARAQRRGGSDLVDPKRRTPARWRRQLTNWLRLVPDPLGIERCLEKAGADLVYFVAPWGRAHAIERLSYWVTVWDLAHVEYDEFPELSGAARARESILNRALVGAGLAVADSCQSKALITQRYGVKAERVVAMSFLPASNLEAADRVDTADVLRRRDLTPGYLFYPAQFWAHKNHVRILEALRLCVDRGCDLHVVFAGGDMGGRRHVEAVAASLQLDHLVHFLGFVDPRDMRGLYEGCLAVVMPTYFGPTNLPPLEAWSIGVPLIYSRHLSEQAGDAALLIDPDDPEDLARAMLSVRDPGVRQQLIDNGHRRTLALGLERVAAEAELLDRLHRFEARMRCSRVTGP